LTLNPLTKKTARYNPKVLITILIVPNVRMLIGNNKILIIGLSTNSKIVITKATLIIDGRLGEKERFFQISFSVMRQKMIIKNILKNFFIVYFF